MNKKITNLALGFIKPHAAQSVKLWDWVRAALEQQGTRISGDTVVTGPEIREQGLIDRHYSVIARVGGCADPSTLELNDKSLAAFESAFGMTWGQAGDRKLLFSGMSALGKLNITPAALMGLWAGVKPAKIGAGFYAASIQGIIVLNGFYPSIREIYTTDSALIRCFLIEFDGTVLPWKRFRTEVIGATDPAKAETGSIRGTLYNRCGEFGLTMNARDNVIHASASPFEAMMERSIWMPRLNPDADPLWKALANSGITRSALTNLAANNPVVTLNGQTASAIDHMEDTDTPETATIIRRLL